MMKFALILSLFVAASNSFATDTCRVAKTDHGKSLEITYPQKNIHILGWRHPSEKEIPFNVDTFLTFANQLGEKASCVEIKETISAAVDNEATLIASSMDLQRRLRKIPVGSSVTLGTESSNVDLQEREKDQGLVLITPHIIDIRDIIVAAKKKCPELSTKLSTFERILLPPEFVLLHNLKARRIDAKLIGIDDKDSFDLILRETTEEERSYNFLNVGLNAQATALIIDIGKQVNRNSAPPTNEQITEILAEIPEGETKSKVEKALKALQLIVTTANNRNKKIAENILKIEGDSITVVGSAHIRGLEKIFLDLNCLH